MRVVNPACIQLVRINAGFLNVERDAIMQNLGERGWAGRGVAPLGDPVLVAHRVFPSNYFASNAGEVQLALAVWWSGGLVA